VHKPSSVSSPTGHDRILVVVCIVAITALAWAYLGHLGRQMSSSTEYARAMAAMGMATDRPWNAADLSLTFAMWTVMMVAMMAGAAAPVLLLFAGALRGRGAGRVPLPLLMFGLGYATIWIGFSGAATGVQWLLHDAALLSPAMAASSPRVAGAILIATGAYQVTRWKSACLAHCRSPLGFLMTHWRNGNIGAFRMGLRHGTYCLGCCWALMCVLFAVGVMNLVWVAALTVLVCLEKIGPAGMMTARGAGVVLVSFGALLLTGLV
jgi:predicted metal-binding membrane protein